MSKKASQDIVDKVIHETDIVSLIEENVVLVPRGNEFIARCLFHEDRGENLTVYPDKQMYHCFICGAHGTAIDFVMNYENKTHSNAVSELMLRLGGNAGEVVEEESLEHDENRHLYGIMEKAAKFFQSQLKDHEDGQDAIDYLKGRGMTGILARDFRVGLAPAGWENLMSHLKDDYSEIILNEVGLVVEREGNVYDRFRDRIIFPIRDINGRVVAFGGRVRGDGEPKYLNSPESPIFHKRQLLYGMYEAIQKEVRLERALVVEGYMDVLSLIASGIDYSVAALGTATTPEQLSLLFKVTDEVVCCFDGDDAGRKAATKAMESALPYLKGEKRIRFMFLPEGHDPDSLVREEGKDAFEKRIESALSLAEFLLSRSNFASKKKVELDDKAKLVASYTSTIAKIPNGRELVSVLSKLADMVGVPVADITELLGGEGRHRRAAVERKEPAKKVNIYPLTPMRKILLILLQKPSMVSLVDAGSLSSLKAPGVEILLELVKQIASQDRVTTASLLELWRDRKEYPWINALAVENLCAHNETFDMESELMDSIRRISGVSDKRRREELIARFSDLSPEEREELRGLQAKMKKSA